MTLKMIDLMIHRCQFFSACHCQWFLMLTCMNSKEIKIVLTLKTCIYSNMIYTYWRSQSCIKTTVTITTFIFTNHYCINWGTLIMLWIRAYSHYFTHQTALTNRNGFESSFQQFVQVAVTVIHNWSVFPGIHHATIWVYLSVTLTGVKMGVMFCSPLSHRGDQLQSGENW